MTIRRQYSLPNCTLVLDGLSDGNSNSGIPDARPVMSSLFNAECHFVGREQPLFGGKDFLTSLVSTVSNYAQAFLSGIQHPEPPIPVPDSLVSLTKGDLDNTHYLQAKLDRSTNPNADGKPAEVKLSTVQLFDLLEAIDQFLADRRTLPDIMVPLQPVTKAIAQPISAQATPIGLGLASLVVASLVGYALPSPQVSKPQLNTPPPVVAPSQPKAAGAPPSAGNANRTPPGAGTTATPTPTPKPSASSTAAPTSALPTKTGKIVDATQLGFLERKLRRDLDLNWQNRSQLKQPLAVNVGVNQDGRVVDYEPVTQSDTARLARTPLPKITSAKSDPNQAVGEFKVVFEPTGSISIGSTASKQGSSNFGKQIAEQTTIASLSQQLQTQLQKSVTEQKTKYAQNLNYRVAVAKTGEIVDYEPQDRTATEGEVKTPLPQLVKFNPQAAISQEPLAQYNVVFMPNGKVQVTPK